MQLPRLSLLLVAAYLVTASLAFAQAPAQPAAPPNEAEKPREEVKKEAPKAAKKGEAKSTKDKGEKKEKKSKKEKRKRKAKTVVLRKMI